MKEVKIIKPILTRKEKEQEKQMLYKVGIVIWEINEKKLVMQW